MLDRLAIVFILAGICTSLMILKDVFRHPLRVRIMNVVRPLTGLYMPFFGWLAWWCFARKNRLVVPLSPLTLRHPPEIKAIFSTTVHCAAGSVVGVIVATLFFLLIKAPPFHSSLLTYALLSLFFSFLFALFFQFIALRQVEKMPFFNALWRAMKSDIFPFIVYQAGMCLFMSQALRFVLHSQIEPQVLHFWFMMQLALFAGFVFAWPANQFLLKRGMKAIF